MTEQGQENTPLNNAPIDGSFQQPAPQQPVSMQGNPRAPFGAHSETGAQPANGAWQQSNAGGAYNGWGSSAPASGPQVSAAQAQAAYAVPTGSPQVKQKKSHGWIVAIVIIVAIFILAAISISSCTSAVKSIVGNADQEGLQLSGNTVAVITLDGTIQYDGSACSPEGFKALLDEAAGNDKVVAVVLRVNSGGGTATAGEEMSTYLRQFRESTGKPVVVSSASINASAAYEISSQADYIYVAKTTEIGAIGTIMTSYDISELMDKLGISIDTIASADSKDSSYGYRPLTEEERAYYQAMVNEINDAFIENVAEGRSMSISAVRELATGLPFAGTTAVHNGIADEIGTLEDAADKAAQLAGVSNYETKNLTLSNYDLSRLAYLLSRSDMSVDQLAQALKENEEYGIVAH